jgi:alkanesulfonate monooxygenase SsuD/methylene tetrahydromethanopterin reductase-like flavin-dependent oxidoreductase (luciferase family)
MVAFGYTLMTEQRGPRELVSDAVAAEQAGFDFEVISDHYFPWLDAQGHAPNAWAVLGAVATATRQVPLMTYVTCPIMRYHPAVVAQQAATVALLAGENRFVLGLGAGENLNEHVVGRGWPPANVRHEMLGEAVTIIRELLGGGYVNVAGEHFRVDSAKLWDLPEQRVPVAVAVSGEQSVEAFGAHEQFRWFGGGWKVNAELPGPAGFAAASQFVRPDDVAEAIPCGPDVKAHVEAVRPFVEAGFTHVALVQIGGETQSDFLALAASELLPALRAEYGPAGDVTVRAR